MVNNSPIVEMRDIHKVYPDGTVALRGVDVDVYEGEVLGLLGENGAGKTTLMKILSGLLRPTKGIIKVRGKEVKFKSPRDAFRYGIGMVHQKFELIPQFTVLENIVLGLEPRGKYLSINWEEARRKVEEIMRVTKFRVDLDAKVGNLPVGARQMVEIIKVLYRNVKILILDEPTSALTPVEVKPFFDVLRRLRREARVTIIFITHKIREALELTDRIVVLRKGLVEGVVKTEEATPELLARMMVRIEAKPLTKPPYRPGEEALIVKDLHVLNDEGIEVVRGASFKVRRGEIYAIVGVEGNGQKELIEAIVGLRKPIKGEVIIRGKGRLLAYIPPDRTNEGLILDMNVADNSILGIQGLFTVGKYVIKYNKVFKHAKELIRKYSIVAPGPRALAKYLSGGNQQKLVLARELSKRPDIVVVANPTMGLDIASTRFVRKLLLDLRSEGKAVLLVTADVDEALEISDRIGVIYEGRIVGEDFTGRMTEEKLGLLMGGVLK